MPFKTSDTEYQENFLQRITILVLYIDFGGIWRVTKQMRPDLMHSWSNSQLAQIHFLYMHQATVLNFRLLTLLALHTLCVQMWMQMWQSGIFLYKEIKKKLWQRCDCGEEMDWSTVWCRTEIMGMRWSPRKDAINTGNDRCKGRKLRRKWCQNTWNLRRNRLLDWTWVWE